MHCEQRLVESFIYAGGHCTQCLYGGSGMKKVAVFLFLAMVLLGSCSNEHKIVGKWTDVEGLSWEFKADGTLSYSHLDPSREPDIYKYSVFEGERRTELTIFEVEYSMYIALGITDQKYTMEYSKDGKTLRLTGAKDLNGWSVAGPGWGTNELTRK